VLDEFELDLERGFDEFELDLELMLDEFDLLLVLVLGLPDPPLCLNTITYYIYIIIYNNH